jgi:hypothetical protein
VLDNLKDLCVFMNIEFVKLITQVLLLGPVHLS